jgi:hypothetical protein
MKNPPPQLTKAWVKANFPDVAQIKPLKTTVEQLETQMLRFAVPGNIKMEDFTAVGKAIDAVAAEVKKLQSVKLTDAAAQTRLTNGLSGYENAFKIARNYYKTVQMERKQASEFKATALAAISTLRTLLKNAEGAVPALANKLTQMLEAYGKAATAAAKKKVTDEAKKLMNTNRPIVFVPKNKSWQEHWQKALFVAHLDKLSTEDKPGIKKGLDEMSQRIGKIVNTGDLIKTKAKPLGV